MNLKRSKNIFISHFRFNKFHGGKEMLLEIPIEYSIEDLRVLAQSKGIDIEYNTRGDLIRELLNLEDNL